MRDENNLKSFISESVCLTGQLLIAMPQMSDPRFHRAVIFICAHDYKGSMGITLNHPLPGMKFSKLLNQFEFGDSPEISAQMKDRIVMCGGPVESARGFLLHGPDFETPDTLKINDQFYMSSTLNALQKVSSENTLNDMLFALGYAGWGDGQIEREIQDNAWLVAPATHEIVFQTPHDMMWHKALGTLGIDPVLLSGHAGHA